MGSVSDLANKVEEIQTQSDKNGTSIPATQAHQFDISGNIMERPYVTTRCETQTNIPQSDIVKLIRSDSQLSNKGRIDAITISD